MKKIALLVALFVCSISALGQSVVTANAHLRGRTIVGTVPRPVNNVQETGTVVVTIWVDSYGNVTKAQAGAEGTTISSLELWTAARSAAMKTHFSQKANAFGQQQGTITYIFTIEKNLPNSLSETVVESDVIDSTAIRFLGIPVDGSSKHMIDRLKERGFEDHFGDYLEGQFNGEPVRVYVHTYRDRVDRIIVDFDHVPEMTLNEQYNHLLSLLAENEKYRPLGTYSPIPIEEDCGTEIFLNKKDYKARFSYVSPTESEESNGEVWLSILNRRGNRVCLYYDNLKNRPRGEDL